VQVREETATLVVPPRSGVLTRCSMYLKEHYVVLNRGQGNFGLHCGAVLLDPIKTFGTNVMLEIYNTGDQPIVNPVVSVERVRKSKIGDYGIVELDPSVESKVKIQPNLADFSLKGQAPLVNTAFEFKVDCSVTSNRGGGTFEAMNIKLIEDTKSPTDALGYVRDLVFTYYPGDTSESFTVTCEDQPPYTAPVSSLWTGVFLVLHQSEMSQAAGGFVLEGWEILGDEYYAKREWINEDAGLGLTEAGTAKLYHLPE